MRVTASYFGLVGGVIGLFWGAGILTLCPGSCPLGVQGSAGMDTLLWGAVAAYFLFIMGVSGWTLAYFRPVVGGWLMLLAGLGSIVPAFPLFLVPGVLLSIGGVLTLTGGRLERERVQMAEAQEVNGSTYHPLPQIES